MNDVVLNKNKSHKQAKQIPASIIGNVIEWFDFTLFAYLAPVIAQQFFPHKSHVAGLLSAFLVFAAGFIVRPLGAIILGHFGDTWGRAYVIKMTIFLVAVPAFAIALLPTYSNIGILAPILLVLLRLFQGLCIGGEFAGSMIYLTEMAPTERRAFISCMSNNGSNVGVLLAVGVCAGVSSVMSSVDFTEYGWRLPFLIGGCISLWGLWLRKDMTESTVFKKIKVKSADVKSPFKYVMQNNRMECLRTCLLLVMSACGTYGFIGFMSTYLHSFLHYSLSVAYQVQTLFILLTFIFVPLFACLADRYGRRLMLSLAALGYIAFSIPCFILLNAGASVLVLLPLVIFYSAEQSTVPATVVENFPATARYTGLSFSYNMTMALVGGTAAFVNTWLISHTGNNTVIAYYLIIGAFISLLTIGLTVPRVFGVACNLAE